MKLWVLSLPSGQSDMKPRYHSKHTITSHYKVETLQSTLNGFLVVVGVQKQELHVGLGEPLLAAPGPHGHASQAEMVTAT